MTRAGMLVAGMLAVAGLFLVADGMLRIGEARVLDGRGQQVVPMVADDGSRWVDTRDGAVPAPATDGPVTVDPAGTLVVGDVSGHASGGWARTASGVLVLGVAMAVVAGGRQQPAWPNRRTRAGSEGRPLAHAA